MCKNNLIILTIFISLLVIFTGCSNNKNNSQSNNNSSGYNTNVKQKLEDLAITTGNNESDILIIEASDFECPACKSIHKEFKKVVEKFEDKVKFGYVAFPLNYHKRALPASYAVEAANMQNKGWEMHEKLFEQTDLSDKGLKNAAKELGLDIEKWESDKESEEVKNKIQKSIELLNNLGIQGTPTFYINGGELAINPTMDNFTKEIEKLLQ